MPYGLRTLFPATPKYSKPHPQPPRQLHPQHSAPPETNETPAGNPLRRCTQCGTARNTGPKFGARTEYGAPSSIRPISGHLG